MTTSKKRYNLLLNFFFRKPNKDLDIYNFLKLFLVIIVPLVLALFLFYHLKTDEKATQDRYQSEFRIISKKSSLSIKEVENYYAKIGPEKILDILNEDKYCHSKGHVIGKVIYEKTKDINKSISICTSKCTTGCIHGVLTGFMGINDAYNHVNIDELKKKLVSICNDSLTLKYIPFGGCIHGVGHAVTLLNNYNLDKSLEFCDQLGENGQIYYCASGVYMEREREYGSSDKQKNPYYPCNSYAYPAACYRYKMYTLFTRLDVPNALDFCKAINNSSERTGCYHGLGFRFFKLVEDNPSSLKDICMNGTFDENRACIEGLMGSLSVVNNLQSVKACNVIGDNFKQICQNAIKVSNFGMDRDFSLYMISHE